MRRVAALVVAAIVAGCAASDDGSAPQRGEQMAAKTALPWWAWDARGSVDVGPGRIEAVGVGDGRAWAAVYDGNESVLVGVTASGALRRFPLPVLGLRGIVDAGDAVWVAGDARVLALHPRSGRVLRSARLPRGAHGLVSIGAFDVGRRDVWAVPCCGSETFVARYDARAGRSVSTVRLGAPAVDVVGAPPGAWVSLRDGSVAAVDASTNAVTARVRLGDDPLYALAAEGERIFATDGTRLSAIDVRTARIVGRRAAPRGDLFHDVVRGPAGTWASTRAGLVRIEPRTLALSRVTPWGRLGRGEIAVGRDALWLTTPNRPLFRRVRVPSRFLEPGRRRARWCRVEDLRGRTETQGATGAQAGAVLVRNVSDTPCTLAGRPHVAYVDARGRPQPVEISYAPGFTLGADEREPWPPRNWPFVLVGPGATAGFSVVARNWCGTGELRLRVRIPQSSATRALVVRGPGGRCDAPEAPGHLTVGPYLPS